MKRSVEREKKLPAFSVSVAELELLWSRLLNLFENVENNRYYSTLNISFPSEKLAFDNIEELKQYSGIKGNVTDFSLTISQYNSLQRVYINSGYILDPHAYVRASGENEAWCAGAIEVVLSFTQNHKLWYNWLVSAPLGWYVFFLSLVPNLVLAFIPKDMKVNKLFVAAWLAIFATLSVLYFARTKILPTSVIRFSDEEGIIKKYGLEITVLCAIISIVLTIIGLFVSK
ncbi:MAG: hypothetical protein HOP21_01755 [Methylotenera sp.]|nr:hypothetical protein [Methylotenera sp.]